MKKKQVAKIVGIIVIIGCVAEEQRLLQEHPR